MLILTSNLVLILLINLVASRLAFGADWAGVDERVVEHFAEKAGRPAWEPFINPSGDILLFAFLLAGTVGGFIAGYYWRDLFCAKDRNKAR